MIWNKLILKSKKYKMHTSNKRELAFIIAS